MEKKVNLKIIKANTFLKKLKGIMFKIKKLDYGILFFNVHEIHTFFCFQNIDIIMLDKNMKIIYLIQNLSPNKIIRKSKKVYYTLEVPIGFILKNNIHTKDILCLTNLEK